MEQIPAVDVVVEEETRAEVLTEIERLLRAGRLTQGANVEAFESEFADFASARHACAVSSGTAALEVILRAIGVTGRTVVVPANTNFATYIAAERAGARVVLADVDPLTLSLTLSELERCSGEDIAVVIVVHIGGIVTPQITAIAAWCRARRIALVEDCAHAHGSSRDGVPAGSFGVAGAYSFFSTKVLTSGEGGMVVTSDAALADEVRILRNLGKPETWVSVHTRMGYNARMHEWAAVLGRANLRALPGQLQARAELLNFYREELTSCSEVEFLAPDHPSSGYKAIVMVTPSLDRDSVKRGLVTLGVHPAGEVYAVPLHQQPVLVDRHGRERHRGAEAACGRQVCLPIYPSLGMDRATRVVKALQTVVSPDTT